MPAGSDGSTCVGDCEAGRRRRPALRGAASHLRLAIVLAITACLNAGCNDSGNDAANSRGGRSNPRLTDLPDGPRNVILLVVDTLRADRLGCYGYTRDTTPNLDRMAADGTLYRDHRPQGVMTIPSMISMMSGLYVAGPEEVLPAYQPTLAELIQRAGFSTIGLAGNKNLTDDRGFDRGFDQFEKIEGGRGHVIVDKFKKWFDANKEATEKAGGFFAWLHFMDPHSPYNPDKDLKKKFDTQRPDQIELIHRWTELYPSVSKLATNAPSLQQFLHPMIEVNNLYDAEVASTDRAIGALRAFLSERGLDENTLLIVASDHGEQLYEAPRYAEDVRRMNNLGRGQSPTCYFDYGHGTSFREESWRTPLIIDGPGFDAGLEISTLTANLDLMPTVLDYFGIHAPPNIQGFTLLSDATPAREQVFGYTSDVFAVKDVLGRKYIDRTARMGIYRNAERIPASDGEPFEIYRLAEGEDNNLAPETPEGVQSFRRLLTAFQRDNDREKDTTLTAEDIQALKELGYLDD